MEEKKKTFREFLKHGSFMTLGIPYGVFLVLITVYYFLSFGILAGIIDSLIPWGVFYAWYRFTNKS